MQTSARRGVSYPSADRSDRPDIPAHFANIVAALELDPSINVGAAASRPANPGYPRYFYWATDTHVMSFWDGSSWYNVGSTDLIPQTLIDAKGDILAGLSDNTVGRVALGAQGYTLSVDTAQASGLKWILDPVMDLVSAKGDILAGTAADALGRVAVGANGTALIADSAQAAGVKFGSPVLTNSENVLGADVTLTTQNTFYDGPSLSLAAGTWFLSANVMTNFPNTGDNGVSKLWDGTTVLASADHANSHPRAGLVGIATPGSTTTYKVSVTNNGANGGSIKASAGAGNTASKLVAIKIG